MKQFLTKRFYILGLSVVLLCEMIAILAIHFGALQFKSDVGLEAMIALPIFLLGLLQLIYSGRLQKTDFIRHYAEEFFTNEYLYSAFHELVYQYTDSKFEEIDAAVKEQEEGGKLNEKTELPFFNFGEGLVDSRKEGQRFYHPKYFQGSLEERRLDMLMGYFDLLGYHYSRGFVSIEDIVGSLGHYLNILSKRKVIQETRKVYREAILDPKYAKVNGRIRPFSYFDKLMNAIESFNARIEERNAKTLNLR